MKKTRIRKDIKRRKLVAQYEFERLKYKFLQNNTFLSFPTRHNAVVNLDNLPKNSSKVRIRNRCVVTGRPRGVYKSFKLSRIQFRELALNGLLPGIKKSSW